MEQILALTLLHIHTLPGGPLPLLCSRSREGGGGGVPHSLTHSHTQTGTLSYGIATGFYSLSPSLSPSLPHAVVIGVYTVSIHFYV